MGQGEYPTTLISLSYGEIAGVRGVSHSNLMIDPTIRPNPQSIRRDPKLPPANFLVP
jgi:hypothetical protein